MANRRFGRDLRVPYVTPDLDEARRPFDRCVGTEVIRGCSDSHWLPLPLN